MKDTGFMGTPVISGVTCLALLFQRGPLNSQIHYITFHNKR
jgi:hypothetical protein